MRVPVDYPTPAEERLIVEHLEAGPPPVSRLLDPEDVIELQRAARAVHIDPATRDYAVRLVLATREPATHGLPRLVGLLEYGASPRASIGLVRAAKALALLRGRDIATPQEVYDVAYDVLNLRLVLSYRALAEGFTIDDVLVELLSTVPAPASPAAWGMAAPAAPSAPPAAPELPRPAPTPPVQAPAAGQVAQPPAPAAGQVAQPPAPAAGQVAQPPAPAAAAPSVAPAPAAPPAWPSMAAAGQVATPVAVQPNVAEVPAAAQAIAPPAPVTPGGSQPAPAAPAMPTGAPLAPPVPAMPPAPPMYLPPTG
jgi:MoxR-like ATPase